LYGVDYAKSILDKCKGKKVLLYGDPDPDGLLSLYLMCDFCNTKGIQYTYFVNDNRVHGFTLQPEIFKDYLIVASDFAITRDEINKIVESGVDIISTDHHNIEDDFIYYESNGYEGVVINNQYPFEPQEHRYRSGAGVIYDVLCEIEPDFKTEERDAVVAITLLTDVRAIENKEAKRYLAGLYQYTDGYIEYLIQSTIKRDYNFGYPRMDRNFVDFTFSPTINSMLRFNKTKEVTDLILRKCNDCLGSVDYHELQKGVVEDLHSVAEVLELSSMYVLAVDGSLFNIDITNFIGLLCSSYKNKGKSSLAFVHEGGRITRASFRGMYDSINYNEEFNKLGIDARGHGNAFGIKHFKPNSQTWLNLDELIKKLEVNSVETRTILESTNLSVSMGTKGARIAHENCFVRDMYRTYFRYKGKNVKEVVHAFKSVPFDDEDYIEKREPDKKVKGVPHKYVYDENGNKITKYIQYEIDGMIVKSFGVGVSEGLILPILDKGYLQLYMV